MTQLLAAFERELVDRLGLHAFVRLAWPHIDGREVVDCLHVRLICEHLEAVSRGEIDRLVINVPPGTGKSIITSVCWPAWDWIRSPWLKWMCASYDDTLALRDARRTRALVDSRWFQERWGAGACAPDPGVSILGNRATAEKAGEFWTQAKGMRFSSTIGSKAVGWHAHRQLVDDPTKPLDVYKRGGEALKRTRAWWQDTMATRRVPNAHFARVVVMQRIHELDLSDWCIREGYHVLCLPAHYDPSHPLVDSQDDRMPGELLCPALQSEAHIEELTRELGVAARAAQLEQRPTPEGGAIYLAAWFGQQYRQLPARISDALAGKSTGVQVIQSWDLAFKGGSKSDWVVGQVWAKDAGTLWLIDQLRGRMGFVDTKAAVQELGRRYPGARSVLIEDAANGPALVDELKRSIPGLRLEPHGGGVLQRSHAVTGWWAAGSVRVPDPQIAPWVQGFVDEHLSFRGQGSDTDDQVSASSLALVSLCSSGSRLEGAMAGARRVMAR